MNEIQHIQGIIIIKSIYALSHIRQTVEKFKDKKRALNQIERVANRTLSEIAALKENLEVRIKAEEQIKTIRF